MIVLEEDYADYAASHDLERVKKKTENGILIDVKAGTPLRLSRLYQDVSNEQDTSHLNNIGRLFDA